MKSETECRYVGVCSGCRWLGMSLDEQRREKTERLLRLWSAECGASNIVLPVEIGFIPAEGTRLRERVDLTLMDGRLGLFADSGPPRTIVDIETCPALSLPLEEWLLDFRKSLPPVTRGSLRLRVSPRGERGVWLDFANVDVKRLLDERTWLVRLMGQATVEIGQRHKRLTVRENQLKLGEPTLFPWFETYVDERAVPLWTTIAGFTQSGFLANRALVGEVMMSVKRLRPGTVHELCAGSGNFTLPLAQVSEHVTAYESEALAVEGLVRSAESAHLTEKITAERSDIYRDFSRLVRAVKTDDILFVDPPRSGLGKFLEAFRESKTLPRAIVYVSCFEESFVRDAGKLQKLGYRPVRTTIVDQFANTPHVEIVSVFELDGEAMSAQGR